MYVRCSKFLFIDMNVVFNFLYTKIMLLVLCYLNYVLILLQKKIFIHTNHDLTMFDDNILNKSKISFKIEEINLIES